MKVLVINAGSSSLKYQLLDPETGHLLAKGLCERIGIDGKFTYKPQVEGKAAVSAADVPMPTHSEAIQAVLSALVDPDNGVISSMKEIDAVGHRVVHGGESFAIAGGTNTFYVDALWGGYAMTQSVPMQALASAKSGAQPVTVNFRYENVDASARSSSQSAVKISVPISQPDRFEISDPVVPDQVIAGQENTVTMEYVNKGKGDIANVEATMEGEGFDATMKTQYVGNVASGATGTIGYAFTPHASGELKTTLKVTYEDSDGQTKTKEFPLAIPVTDMQPVDDSDMADPNMDQSANQGLPVLVYVVIVVIAVVIIVVIVLLVRRRRKQKAKKNDIDEDWDDWSEGKDDKTDTDVTDGAAADTAPIAPASPASPAGPSHKA